MLQHLCLSSSRYGQMGSEPAPFLATVIGGQAVLRAQQVCVNTMSAHRELAVLSSALRLTRLYKRRGDIECFSPSESKVWQIECEGPLMQAPLINRCQV